MSQAGSSSCDHVTRAHAKASAQGQLGHTSELPSALLGVAQLLQHRRSPPLEERNFLCRSTEGGIQWEVDRLTPFDRIRRP
mmetsp:Transcript_12664/g.32126  ORF Transcript_12664/g.32126 Transcript_12664/m.32126 type:complete len:81 (-) Transcript_12664:740-982(-)|eukprot:5062433-Prymnesium_polylepis.5